MSPVEGSARAAGRPVPGSRQQAKEEEREERQGEEEREGQRQREQRKTGGREEAQGGRSAAQTSQSEESARQESQQHGDRHEVRVRYPEFTPSFMFTLGLCFIAKSPLTSKDKKYVI